MEPILTLGHSSFYVLWYLVNTCSLGHFVLCIYELILIPGRVSVCPQVTSSSLECRKSSTEDAGMLSLRDTGRDTEVSELGNKPGLRGRHGDVTVCHTRRAIGLCPHAGRDERTHGSFALAWLYKLNYQS